VFIDWTRVRVFVRPGHTDMRKQAFGLSVLVTEELSQDPFSGYLFLFCNKRRTILKGLYWEQNGFWLVSKKLEKHKFPWPQDGGLVAEISEQQLRWLLAGIDFWRAHEPLSYSQIK
jgi:transposase